MMPNLLLSEERVAAAALNIAGEEEISIARVEEMWAPGINETWNVCVQEPWIAAGVKKP